MIDWVSIVRHSRHRISSYVSPRRRTDKPSDRYTVCTDSIPLPHHAAKSKVSVRTTPNMAKPPAGRLTHQLQALAEEPRAHYTLELVLTRNSCHTLLVHRPTASSNRNRSSSSNSCSSSSSSRHRHSFNSSRRSRSSRSLSYRRPG